MKTTIRRQDNAVEAAAHSGSGKTKSNPTQLKRNAVPILQKENNTGMSDNLKSGIENLSGMAMDDVKVHYNSDRPAQLQAHAFAQGTDIHVAPGQEKHLPHEAWHVVQQKQGRVQPTVQLQEEDEAPVQGKFDPVVQCVFYTECEAGTAKKENFFMYQNKKVWFKEMDDKLWDAKKYVKSDKNAHTGWRWYNLYKEKEVEPVVDEDVADDGAGLAPKEPKVRRERIKRDNTPLGTGKKKKPVTFASAPGRVEAVASADQSSGGAWEAGGEAPRERGPKTHNNTDSFRSGSLEVNPAFAIANPDSFGSHAAADHITTYLSGLGRATSTNYQQIRIDNNNTALGRIYVGNGGDHFWSPALSHVKAKALPTTTLFYFDPAGGWTKLV